MSQIQSVQSIAHLSLKQIGVIGVHALVGWALCGAIMGVGPCAGRSWGLGRNSRPWKRR
jgi:hypothetical protein